VARALVADPDALAVHVAIDGVTVQRSSTAGRIRGAARLIADITEFMTLFCGDVLMLGSAHPAPRARAGQRVSITIDGVGRLDTLLVAEKQP
jgi:5-oxopent-3-ene-1,2,5-tricarboxylate decarboxylase/2-hydroxyhepta-2,4-diene-1,7-dioate isomerase